MDFADRIRQLSQQVQRQAGIIQTEEATKNAMVMPFISALGYDVFDPSEVTPELHADVGVKKGEKVDYAILKDGKPIMLFECKWHGADLSKEHASQLYRYFSVTEARFGVLTNGLAYRFFTDLDAPNKMDGRPFFEFDMTDYREHDIDELRKFSKASFDVQGILTTANELKYLREIQKLLAQQLQSPSEDFVRFFTQQVYQGRMTQAIKEQFTETTRQAFKRFINEQINDRLKSALGSDQQYVPIESASVVAPSLPAPEMITPDVPAIVTTTDELAAYFTIRAILHPVSSRRIVMRDVQSYCGVLLDDNNRKPICRLYLNGPRKAIGLFDSEDRKEERIPISDIEEIHEIAERLRATVQRYDRKPSPFAQ